MTKDVEVGDEFAGKVVKTTTFGAFIELSKGTDGLLHISNLSPGERVETVEDVSTAATRSQVRWSRSTASAAASACAWPRTRRSPASRPRSSRTMGTGDRAAARDRGGDRDGRGGDRGSRGGGGDRDAAVRAGRPRAQRS